MFIFPFVVLWKLIYLFPKIKLCNGVWYVFEGYCVEKTNVVFINLVFDNVMLELRGYIFWVELYVIHVITCIDLVMLLSTPDLCTQGAQGHVLTIRYQLQPVNRYESYREGPTSNPLKTCYNILNFLAIKSIIWHIIPIFDKHVLSY